MLHLPNLRQNRHPALEGLLSQEGLVILEREEEREVEGEGERERGDGGREQK